MRYVLAWVMALFLWGMAGTDCGLAQTRSTGELRGRITAAPGRSGTRSVSELRRFLLLNRYLASRATGVDIGAVLGGADEPTLGERAVVFLEGPGLPKSRASASSQRPVLDQRHLQFRPQVLPVLLGTTVEFPNSDDVFHNVFSYSEPREFDLGRYPKGDARAVRFDEPGVVRIYCDIHAHMNATVIVLPHTYFAVPADDGSYVIRDIPDGDYTATFWYGREKADERPVRIRGGVPVTLDFHY